MKRLLIAILLLCPLAVRAQEDAQKLALHAAGKILLVLPFENRSSAPGLEWIGESFPEVLNERMVQPELFIISREDRTSALDRMGIPANTNPSRATIYTLAQAMDVDYAVLGSYDYDGHSFSAQAQLLDLRNVRLSPPMRESGPLTQLTEIQTALAYDLLNSMHLGHMERGQFMARSPYVRLDSLESFVRGVLANSGPERIRRFKEAVRISPDYNYAKLALGHTYLDARDYEPAAAWFGRIPQNLPMALEANFFLGICEYQLGDFARSQQAFQFVMNRLPLTEVRNDLGVASAHKNSRAAADAFRRTVDIDPRDEDYRFNYALALAQSGDAVEALHQAKEALAIRPADADARALLDSLSGSPGQAASRPAATPAISRVSPSLSLRLKRNYDETTFRQAELEMRNVEELVLAAKGTSKQAQAHVERGTQMLNSGFYSEAEEDFREAVAADPQLAAAHVGLAHIAVKNNDAAVATAEVNQALALEPRNADALNLKRYLQQHPSPTALPAAAQKALP